MALIRNGKVVPDPWRLLRPADDGAAQVVPPAGDVIVPFAMWAAQRGALLARRSGRLGVWLAGNDDPERITGDLAHFRVIAVEFPHATDGRGYSIARLLRERCGWRGELRAVGDVQCDQLAYLRRCGFDAFALREGEAVGPALAALGGFSEAYQASVEQPLPLFRRRYTNSPDGMELS